MDAEASSHFLNLTWSFKELSDQLEQDPQKILKYVYEIDNNNTHLHNYCREGISVPIVTLLLQKGADVNALNKVHKSPLEFAVESTGSQKIPIIHVLLSYGAHVQRETQNFANKGDIVDNCSKKYFNILLVGILSGETESVDAIYTFQPHSLDQNVWTHLEGQLPAMIKQGHTSTIQWLHQTAPQKAFHLFETMMAIKTYKERSIENSYKGNALHHSSLSLNFDLIEFLLNCGMDPCVKDSNCKTGVEILENETKRQKLDVSQEDSYKRVVYHLHCLMNPKEYLWQYEANVCFIKHPKYGANFKFDSERTLLHIVCERGKSVPIAELLIKAGADINIEDTEHQSPLDLALKSSGPMKNDILKLLFQNGASTGRKTTIQDYLERAFINDDLDTMKMLCTFNKGQHRMDMKEIVYGYKLEIRRCLAQNKVEMIRFLCECTSNDLINSLKEEIEYRACLFREINRKDVPIIIQRRGKTMDFSGITGRGTGLHLACLTLSDDIVSLLHHWSLLEIQDSNGQTPGQIRKQQLEGMKGLLAINEDATHFFWHDVNSIPDDEINLANNEGKTLLHILCLKGNSPKIVKLLIKKGASLIALDSKGLSPLHYVIDSKGTKKYETLKVLLQYGAKTLFSPDKDVFMHGILQGDSISIKLMFKFNNDVIENTKVMLEKSDEFSCRIRYLIDEENVQLLEFLFKHCKHYMEKSLVKHLHYDYSEACFNSNPKGTGFHFACLKGRYDVINFMLARHLAVPEPDSEGSKPIDLLKVSPLSESLRSELEARISGKFQNDYEKENNPQTKVLYKTQYEIRKIINSLQRSNAPEEITKITSCLGAIEDEFNQSALHSQELVSVCKDVEKLSSKTKESDELRNIAKRVRDIEAKILKVSDDSKQLSTVNNTVKALVQSEEKHAKELDTKITHMSKNVEKMSCIAEFALHRSSSVSAEYIYHSVARKISETLEDSHKARKTFIKKLLEDHPPDSIAGLNKVIDESSHSMVYDYLFIWKLWTVNLSTTDRLKKLQEKLQTSDLRKLRNLAKELKHEIDEESAALRKTATIFEQQNLTKLAQKVGKRWRELGRLLGVLDADLDDIESQVQSQSAPSQSECAFKMLLKWSQSRPEEGAVKLGIFVETLAQNKMYDLIQHIKEIDPTTSHICTLL